MKLTPTLTRLALLLTAIGAVHMAGCKAMVKADPQQKVANGAEELQDTEFLEWLSNQPLVRSQDLYRAILLLKDGETQPANFNSLDDKVRQDDLIANYIKLKPGQAANNGTVAYMLCKVTKQVGGINWALTGLPRYAYREMVYNDIMVPGRAEYQYITGGELVDCIGRADRLMKKRGLYAEPKENVADPADAGGAGGGAASAPASASASQP